MKFQGKLPILLVLAIIFVSNTSARKSGRDRKSTTTSTEISVGHSVESGDKDHEGLSAELLGLKDNARNITTETSTQRPREKKQKHRRKNKHHRGPHRQKKRNRTRPTDILRAEDDKVPNQQGFPNSNFETLTDSQSNEKLPIPRNHRKGNKKNGRNRGTRHSDRTSGASPRKFTNGHHGGNQNQEESEVAEKQHKRRRIHHKKHKKPFTPSFHDTQGRNQNKNEKFSELNPQVMSSVKL